MPDWPLNPIEYYETCYRMFIYLSFIYDII